MKAILVVDMPNSCYECNFAIDVCHGTIPPQEYYNKRPSWCPLKPLPKKRDYSEEFADTRGFDMYMEGWNDCLEEIEK